MLETKVHGPNINTPKTIINTKIIINVFSTDGALSSLGTIELPQSPLNPMSSVTNLSDKQIGLIEDLNLIEDPQERLSALVARGSASRLPETLKSEENLVRGCMSRVWVAGSLENGRCRFICDADSPMVKGLVALLCDLYSDAPPSEVVATEPELWEQCGFTRLLSPTRLNGLRSVRARISELALVMGSETASGT